MKGYNTNYWILDKETGEKLFQTSHNSCFSDFVPYNFNDKEKGFAPGRKMEIMHQTSRFNWKFNSPENINWWTEYLNKIGFPVTLDIAKRRYTRKTPINKPVEGKPAWYMEQARDEQGNLMFEEKEVFDEECYVWTLDFDEYSSKAHLKIGCYLIRYLYEDYNENGGQPELIGKVKRYCEKYPEAEPFEVFCFMHMFKSPSGHCWWYQGNVLKGISLEELSNKIEYWKSKEYNNNEYSELTRLGFIELSPSYVPNINHSLDKNKVFTEDMSWSSYKEELGKLMNVKKNDVEPKVEVGEEVLLESLKI